MSRYDEMPQDRIALHKMFARVTMYQFVQHCDELACETAEAVCLDEATEEQRDAVHRLVHREAQEIMMSRVINALQREFGIDILVGDGRVVSVTDDNKINIMSEDGIRVIDR